MLIIPTDQMDKETLTAVLEEFITREGTDYGEHEWTLEAKLNQLHAQLAACKACLCYDPVGQSCSVLPKEQALLLVSEPWKRIPSC